MLIGLFDFLHIFEFFAHSTFVDINPLSDRHLAKKFFHSVSCLFIQLTFFFSVVVKKKKVGERVSQDLLSPEWTARALSFCIENQVRCLKGRNQFSLAFLFREYVYEHREICINMVYLGRNGSLHTCYGYIERCKFEKNTLHFYKNTNGFCSAFLQRRP